MLGVDSTTDYGGNCQLQVKALPEWLGIPIIYRVWAHDPVSGRVSTGHAFDVYAGGSYYVGIYIVVN